MRALVWLVTVILLALPAAAQDKKEVDLALALGIDISGSIDPDEARLQREGYFQAFRDPVVVKAILGGPNGRIVVAYFEWSDSWMQKLLIDWTLLDSEAAVVAFAHRLADAPISIARRTSISGAIRYAIPLFGRSPYEAQRKVLDISGDGSNNDGGLVTEMRHEALRDRIVINGLPIMLHTAVSTTFDISDLDQYYGNCVIGGAGAFMVPVKELKEFASAIRRKLLLEISGFGTPARVVPAQNALPAEGYDCLTGEKRWRQYFDRIPN